MIKASFIPYEGSENYIFVSYAHKDSADVIPILERLNIAGYRVWYDENLHIGGILTEDIANHIEKSKVFLFFVSPNSNESDFCLDELSFAKHVGKPFLSIILHETNMTSGLTMQLSSRKWIAKYEYADDDQFYEKLLSNPILFPCKKKIENVPPITPAPESLPVKETPSGVNDLPEISNPDINLNKGDKLSEFIKHLAMNKVWKHFALLLILSVLIIVSVRHIRQIGTQAESAQIESGSTVGGDFGGGHITIPPEVFWGTQTCIESSYSNLSNFSSTHQTADGVELELVVLPISMTVSANDPRHMILTLQDKYDVSYDFISDFSVEDGFLILSTPSDYAQEENPLPILTNDLQYKLTISNYEIHLTYDNESRTYKNIGRGNESLTLQGTSCSENDIYDGILSIDIDSESNAEGTACQLFFENGGYSTVAKINTINTNISSITVSMYEEIIPYNGRMQENHRAKNYHFSFINTYPYGFIIKDDVKYYRYQNPVMQLNDPAES